MVWWWQFGHAVTSKPQLQLPSVFQGLKQVSLVNFGHQGGFQSILRFVALPNLPIGRYSGVIDDSNSIVNDYYLLVAQVTR